MMHYLNHKTKVVATIGPASSSPEVLTRMVKAGMNVARLNFSHGSYDDHARRIALIRSVAEELDTPITLLQDLQGPKIRVGQLLDDGIFLMEGEFLTLVPINKFANQPNTVPIDYPHLAEEARLGNQILLDDGLLELSVDEIESDAVRCKVIRGGILKSRKGVNLPQLDLRLPSLTNKDLEDLDFGLSQDIDYVCLSFVRRAEDIRTLKNLLVSKGAGGIPVVAKIEKPQAIANLEAILEECDVVMVARGDLGVEMSPEKVPLLQKRIIRLCNQKGLPVITATQMLDSMIHNARPTRAEASDVANAIIDGTDAVMLSGESAVGEFPVASVEMLVRIATDIEPETEFVNNPPAKTDETHALSEALNAIDKVLNLKCIVTFTSTGYTARLASGERPKAPIVALTPNPKVYQQLNLIWGIRPVLLNREVDTFEDGIAQVQTILQQRGWVQQGDKILILGGIPMHRPQGTNFLKIHTIDN
ncbi:MAG: pyruvate kinase [Scytonema sp. PMC 1069.18]|nr:pyruvate kinase [Scytonema sp. PMC 1069.18]MEC4884096.1 pyruvate kinase [Scytonema sp. PMC 1070.18]